MTYKRQNNFNDSGCTKHLGCYKDESDRAIGTKYSTGSNPVQDCHEIAVEKGYTHYAVESEDECFTSDTAGSTYDKYGRLIESDCGNDGVGGDWTMDVYKIVPCSTGGF